MGNVNFWGRKQHANFRLYLKMCFFPACLIGLPFLSSLLLIYSAFCYSLTFTIFYLLLYFWLHHVCGYASCQWQCKLSKCGFAYSLYSSLCIWHFKINVNWLTIIPFCKKRLKIWGLIDIYNVFCRGKVQGK